MKKRLILAIVVCFCCLGASAAGVKPGSAVTLVDSCGFFPQMSADGQWLLYSPTEGTSLMLKNLAAESMYLLLSQALHWELEQ